MIYMDILKRRYNSWQELESVIEGLSTTKQKGDAFEQFCYAYFILKKDKYKLAEIYENGKFPEDKREKYKLEDKDHGVDGLIITEDGKSIAYQCKFRNGRAKPTYEELSKFWNESRFCDAQCVFANCSSITDVAAKQEKSFSILVNDLDDLDELFFENLYTLTNAATEQITRRRYDRRPYQENIVQAVVNGFQVENRGKLIAACGTGKTLTSLWIAEDLNSSTVLFLAPSIALVKQTLESWCDQAKEAFDFLCVCSDNSVTDDLDDAFVDILSSDLGVPVTTDSEEIASFLRRDSQRRKVVFSTYQSADKISEGTLKSNSVFDLIICDEAHRTAGEASNFNLAVSDYYIPAQKRLFMTATERLVSRTLQDRAESQGRILFSMDDESIYGPLFYKYGFDKAIQDGTIADYKIILSCIRANEVYDFIRDNSKMRLEDVDEKTRIDSAQSLYVKILLAKAMNQYNIRKAISFHSSIARAKNFVDENEGCVPLRTVIRSFAPQIQADDLVIENISCKLSANERTAILQNFKNRDAAIVSNAKCLTEGVDVPVIDCVYFVDKKKSLVDIVQACGRALRIKPGQEKTAYFIVPILIPDDQTAGIFNQEDFQRVYDIVQSLRDQDSRLEDWITLLNQKYVRGEPLERDDSDPIIFDVESMDLQEFGRQLYTQIATEESIINNPDRPVVENTDRATRQTRTIKTLCDYRVVSLLDSVNKTIEKFISNDCDSLPKQDVKIDHNNIANTERLGLIKKVLESYTLTSIGKKYRDKEIEPSELIQRQLSLYSTTMESPDRSIFSYRTIMKVIKGLDGKKALSALDYMFCIYTMRDGSQESIDAAIENIRYLRLHYPNLKNINNTNKEPVLNELNTRYQTQLSDQDIWGSTTVRNQFGYMANHLCSFSSIFELDRDRNVVLKENGVERIDELLNEHPDVESLSREEYLNLYTTL